MVLGVSPIGSCRSNKGQHFPQNHDCWRVGVDIYKSWELPQAFNSGKISSIILPGDFYKPPLSTVNQCLGRTHTISILTLMMTNGLPTYPPVTYFPPEIRPCEGRMKTHWLPLIRHLIKPLFLGFSPVELAFENSLTVVAFFAFHHHIPQHQQNPFLGEKSLLATHVRRTTWASVAPAHRQSVPRSYTALPVWLDVSRDPQSAGDPMKG